MSDLVIPFTRLTPKTYHLNESSKHYILFCKYRDTSPSERSLRVVADYAGLHPGTIGQLASRYAWRERALAWDDHITQSRNEQMKAKQLAQMELEYDGWSQLEQIALAHLENFQMMGVDRDVTVTDPKTGQPVRVITRGLRVVEFKQLVQAYDQITIGKRRSIGLPSQISTQHVDHTGLHEVDIRQKVEFVWTDQSDNSGFDNSGIFDE